MVQTGVLEREKGDLIILYQVKSFHERPCQAHGDCGGPREQLPYLRSQHPWSSPRGTAVCCAKSRQSCLPLYDPMDCSPPASSVHGILQARTLEWAISSSGDLPTQGSKSCLLCLLLWQVVSLPLEPSGKPRGKINLTALICPLGPLHNPSLPGLALGYCVYCTKAA